MIGCNDIISVLNNLNNNSAPGLDGFTALFYKQIRDHLILPYFHKINCSITSDTVLDELKVARLIPVHKNGNKKRFQ